MSCVGSCLTSNLNFHLVEKCGGTIIVNGRESFQTPFYPTIYDRSNFKEPPVVSCEWILIAPQGKSIYLEFPKVKNILCHILVNSCFTFILHQLNTINLKEKLTIADGSNVINVNSLGAFSGSNSTRTFISSENECVVVFDYHGRERMKGFVGYYDVYDIGTFHNGRLKMFSNTKEFLSKYKMWRRNIY